MFHLSYTKRNNSSGDFEDQADHRTEYSMMDNIFIVLSVVQEYITKRRKQDVLYMY